MDPNSSAFPLAPVEYEPEFGLKVRDYIAIRVMQSMLVNPYWDNYNYEMIAEASYEMAEAMVAKSTELLENELAQARIDKEREAQRITEKSRRDTAAAAKRELEKDARIAQEAEARSHQQE